VSTPKLLLPIPVFVLTLAASAAIDAEDWPQFRGPGSNGISDAKNLPTTWGDSENLLWKIKLPGAGASSPIILENRLYVTCHSGYGTYVETSGDMEDLGLHVVCVDLEKGKTVWDTKIAPKLPESSRVRDHGYSAPTPATDGKHLYVFFGKSGVFKLGLDGKRIWQADVGSRTHGWGCGTSPVLFKNLVIVNASVESKSLVAIDKKSGKEVWRAPGMSRAWNTPHLIPLENGKTELAVSVKGSILGFDPATGDQLWTCRGIQDYVCPSIVSHKGIAYALGGRTSRAIAVRAGGRGDVTESHRLWEAPAGANVASPVIHDGHIYWVSDRNRVAYCLRLSDGEVITERRVKAQPYASALLADGKIFVVTRRGGTFVLEAKPDFKELAYNSLDDASTFNASPVAVGERLYLRSDRFLYCVGKKS